MENKRTVTGMSEYIDRKALRDTLYDADAITMNGVKILNQFPPADVAPVRHGNWCWEGRFRACSICGSYVEFTETLGASHWKYCPYCGAKMDLEVTNGS